MMHVIFHLAVQYSVNAQSLGIPTDNPTIGSGLTKVVTLLSELIGMAAIVMVIVGGLQIVLASGNPARFKQGRETVIYAVVGLAVAISAYAIVTYISGSFK